jgi:DNA-binding MarR family transcriptional regulator
MTHPVAGCDDVVHQRVRLGILAILTELPRAAFSYLQSALAVTEGNLSTHLKALDDAGYIRIDKQFEKNRPRTWVSITATGKTAFANEIVILRDVVKAWERSNRR